MLNHRRTLAEPSWGFLECRFLCFPAILVRLRFVYGCWPAESSRRSWGGWLADSDGFSRFSAAWTCSEVTRGFATRSRRAKAALSASICCQRMLRFFKRPLSIRAAVSLAAVQSPLAFFAGMAVRRRGAWRRR